MIVYCLPFPIALLFFMVRKPFAFVFASYLELNGGNESMYGDHSTSIMAIVTWVVSRIIMGNLSFCTSTCSIVINTTPLCLTMMGKWAITKLHVFIFGLFTYWS
jgi:hypothetical protein